MISLRRKSPGEQPAGAGPAADRGGWLRRKTDDAARSGDLDTTYVAGQRLTTRLANVGLAALVLCGPIALLASAAPGAPAPRSTKQLPVGPSAQDAARAGEFATVLVRTWLTATRENPGNLDKLFRGARPATLPDRGTKVDNTAVADVSTTPVDQVLAVTVAATVEGTLRYFAVPVRITPSGLSALTLPAPAPEPLHETGAALRYGSSVMPSGAIGTAVAAFLTALLTGTGEITRYITPGAEIRAVDPAPYRRAQLRSLMATDEEVAPLEGTEARVLVTAVVTDGLKRQLTTQYALSLKARGGRWEVAAVDTAPVVNIPTPTPTRTPTTAPTSSSSGTPR